MPSWKKVIISGSNAALNSLNVTNSLTASGIIYPTTDGTSGQVVITDGNGNLSFSNVENTTISIKNISGTTIAKGTPCYITGSGTSGNLAGVWPADASNPLRMPAGVIAGESLTAGAEGVGLINGFISGVNTSTFNAGDSVYVAVGGGYTNIRPTGSSVLIQKLGNIEKSHASNGSGVINGPGYYNEVPNIQQGYTWVGNSDGVATPIATSSIQNVVSSSFATSASYALTAGSTTAIAGTTNYVSKFTGASTLGNSLVYDNGTNVGIGTASPLSKLHVSDTSGGAIYIQDSDSTSTYNITSISNGGGNLSFDTRNSSGAYVSTDYQIVKDVNGANYQRWFTQGSERMRITSTGNVGIGTSSPTTKLQISSTMSTSPTSNIFLDVSGTNNTGGGGSIFFGTSATAGSTELYNANISGVRSSAADGSSDLLFATTNVSTSTTPATRLIIKDTGNVGIGTNSPSEKLDVSGDIIMTDAITSQANLKSSGGTIVSHDLNTGDYTFANSAIVSNPIASTTILNTGGSERMRIDSDGNVGIGTSSPSALLHIGQSNTTTDALIRLGVAYSSDRTSRGGITWNDITNVTGKIYTEYDGTMVSMVFGSLYNSGYNSNTLMTIRGNGNVGIGTSSPGAKLDIGGASGEMIRLVDSSTTGNPFISFFQTSTRRAYIQYVDSGDNLTLASEYGGIVLMTGTGGTETEKMRITSAGDVGIGTNSPSEKLDVSGDIIMTDAITSQANLKSLGGTIVSHDLNTGDYTFANSAIVSNPVASTTIFNTGGSESMRIDADGNLGIGTDSPDQKLVISGSNNVYSKIATSATNSTLGINLVNDARSWIVRVNGDDSDKFQITDASADAQRVTIDTSGNVGIGTTTPGHKLDVNGSLHSTYLNIADAIYHEGDTDTYIQFISSNTIRWVTGGTERIRLNSSGNVGIGTDNPGFTLDITGTGRATTDFRAPIFYDTDNTAYYANPGGTSRLSAVQASNGTAGAPAYGFVNDTNNGMYYIVTDTLAFSTAGSERLRITAGGAMGLGVTPTNTAGRFEASNDIVAYSSSDKNWKKNIINIDSPLRKISQINGVEFDWMEDEPIHGNKGHDVGVIAQEIELVIPEAVQTRESGMKAVQYDKIIPLLIESIKEQQKQIDELKAIVEKLQNDK